MVKTMTLQQSSMLRRTRLEQVYTVFKIFSLKTTYKLLVVLIMQLTLTILSSQESQTISHSQAPHSTKHSCKRKQVLMVRIQISLAVLVRSC